MGVKQTDMQIRTESMSQEAKKISRWMFVLWGYVVLMVIAISMIGELHVLGTVLLAGISLTCVLLLAIKNMRMKVVNIDGMPNVL